jgi:hypothetical protein
LIIYIIYFNIIINNKIYKIVLKKNKIIYILKYRNVLLKNL